METQTITISAKSMKLTDHGKRIVAYRWLQKGMNFIGGYILLKQRGGDHFVSLHLFCQGMEIILKACLLMFDYNTYAPLMGPKKYGHNLEGLAFDVIKVFGVRALSEDEFAELQQLSNLYSKHVLRYATMSEILFDTSGVTCDNLLWKMNAVCHLAKRYSPEAIQAAKNHPES